MTNEKAYMSSVLMTLKALLLRQLELLFVQCNVLVCSIRCALIYSVLQIYQHYDDVKKKWGKYNE